MMHDGPSPLSVAERTYGAEATFRLREIADHLGVSVEAFFESATYPLHRSMNGDIWSVTRSMTGQVVVRHTSNAASGDHVSEVEFPVFLARDQGSPQHAALMRLLEGLAGTLLCGAGLATA